MSSAPDRNGDRGSSSRPLPATAVWGGHRGGEQDKPAHDGKQIHQPPTTVNVNNTSATGFVPTSTDPTPFDLVRPGEAPASRTTHAATTIQQRFRGFIVRRQLYLHERELARAHVEAVITYNDVLAAAEAALRKMPDLYAQAYRSADAARKARDYCLDLGRRVEAVGSSRNAARRALGFARLRIKALHYVRYIMVAQRTQMTGRAAIRIQAWLRGTSVRRTLLVSNLPPTSNDGIRFMGGSVPTPSHELSDRDIMGIDKPVITLFVPFSKKTRRRQRRRGRPPRTGGTPYYTSSSRLLTYPGPPHLPVPTALGSKKLNIPFSPSPKRRRRCRRYRSRYRSAWFCD